MDALKQLVLEVLRDQRDSGLTNPTLPFVEILDRAMRKAVSRALMELIDSGAVEYNGTGYYAVAPESETEADQTQQSKGFWLTVDQARRLGDHLRDRTQDVYVEPNQDGSVLIAFGQTRAAVSIFP